MLQANGAGGVGGRRGLARLSGAADDLAPHRRRLAGRQRAGAALEQHVGDWVASQTAASVERRLQAVGVPAGLVADGDDRW